jgi:hypothetical protein
MSSKRRHEGYLMIDNRASPGVPEAMLDAANLPLTAGRGLFETATYTCSHCQAVVVLNPNRSRERAYCRGCDHYICDACGIVKAKTLQCRTFKQLVDEVLTAAEKQTDSTAIPILLRC